MPILHNNITINALVSLELDPATADSDFPLIVSLPRNTEALFTMCLLQLFHKDQANSKASGSSPRNCPRMLNHTVASPFRIIPMKVCF